MTKLTDSSTKCKHHVYMMENILLLYNTLHKHKKACKTVHSKIRVREQRSLEEMYNMICPEIRIRAYCMNCPSFWKLYNKIKFHLYQVCNNDNDNYVGYVHNRYINPSVWLAFALCYFAGASPYDLLVHYGISMCQVYDSMWYVVSAINMVPDMSIDDPIDVDE